MYNAFDRYFYLRRIATSKEDLQPYIWVVPSLFQEGTFSDLVFSRVPSFFEISICNRLCFQWYWVNSLPVHLLHPFDEWPFFCYKRAVVATRSFKFTVFFQNKRSCSKEISSSSTVMSPWLQVCINWKITCYLTTSVPAIHVFIS